jgi:hypothetical protein
MVEFMGERRIEFMGEKRVEFTTHASACTKQCNSLSIS